MTTVDIHRLRRTVFTDIGLLLALAGYYLLHGFVGLSIPCPFHAVTGLLCPGCGVTRCLFSILRLDFSSAFHYNRLVFILLPIGVIYIIAKQYLVITNQEEKMPKRLVDVVSMMLVVGLLVFGVVRNIM